MTRDAVAVTAVVALALGWCTARWRIAENDRVFAKARMAGAAKAAWRARRAVLVVALVAYAAIDVWIRGAGR